MTDKNSNKVCGFSPDRAAQQINNALLRDFRRVEGPNFCRGWDIRSLSEIGLRRAVLLPALGEIPVCRFKAYQQMSSLLKRHIFETEASTGAIALAQLSFQDFFGNQMRLAEHQWIPRSTSTHLVLQEARKIAKRILGPVDMDAIESEMRFGKRAMLGYRLGESYLDTVIVPQPTLPPALVPWLKDHVRDPMSRRLIPFKGEHSIADYLELSSVPKSWKIKRIITPLTPWGLYFSHGLGGTIVHALKSAGLDIKRLQVKHQALAKRFSVCRSHVTADLSKASDSITIALLMAILPRAWFHLLRKILHTTVHLVNTDDTVKYHAMSVLPMGNGATFPIETLIFYCLIRAVGNLLKKSGTYSVYGDDLIYPRKIHTHVLITFEKLGIKINRDKTFCESFFRESCGGDYYHGSDVRPAMLPEHDGARLTKSGYIAWLYKSYNALQRRWSMEFQLQETGKWILMEISSLSRWIFQVPPSYTDTAGIKTESVKKCIYWPWAKVRLVPSDSHVPKKLPPDVKVWEKSFSALGTVAPSKREVTSEAVYYWDRLRKSHFKSTMTPQVVWCGVTYGVDETFSTTIDNVSIRDKEGKPLLDKRSKQIVKRCVDAHQQKVRYKTQTFSVYNWE